jgi:restriction system protein
MAHFWLWHKVIGALVEGSYDTLATELLDRILAQPPMFLETLSLKLLQAMEHTGKPGDSGLDGMVRQLALGVGTAFAHTTDTSRKFL